jgi:hypothetical protein
VGHGDHGEGREQGAGEEGGCGGGAGVEVRRHGVSAVLGGKGALNEAGGFVPGCYRGRIGAFSAGREDGRSVGVACNADWNDEASKSSQRQRRMAAVADYSQEDCVSSWCQSRSKIDHGNGRREAWKARRLLAPPSISDDLILSLTAILDLGSPRIVASILEARDFGSEGC